VDDRYWVVLDKEVRKFLKVKPGDKVLAIPSFGRGDGLSQGKEVQHFSPWISL
jgi:hypothetical protein